MKVDKYIEDLNTLFANKEEVCLSDFFNYYKEKEGDIPAATVNWRIYDLVQKGILKRVGRGVYSLGKTQEFTFEISNKTKKAAQKIMTDFPYIKYCIWELSVINKLSQHLINYNAYFVDVERDVCESVFFFLKDEGFNVILQKNVYDDLSEFAGYIIVRNLVSESPVKKVKKITVASIEKILIDLYADKIFLPFQGNEIKHIFETAFENYTINENTLLRYASRKEKKDAVELFLKSIKRQ